LSLIGFGCVGHGFAAGFEGGFEGGFQGLRATGSFGIW